MTNVLIVDDSIVDRRLAGGILEQRPNVAVRYAENGADALAKMGEQRPDIVVTDLQMPEMNGLELVGYIRSSYPLVPVILMTAHGSEDIAVEALQQGAASYVPKSSLADSLLDTVENVLAVARADRRKEEVLDRMTYNESQFVLDNDAGLIPSLVDHLQQQIIRLGLCDETGRIRVGIALEEALLNALYHGNLELSVEELQDASAAIMDSDRQSLIDERRSQPPYKDRRLSVRSRIDQMEAVYVIEDEGPGFDPDSIGDPNDPANLDQRAGRGLVLMRTFMDEVTFNETGNQVTMIKRREYQSG